MIREHSSCRLRVERNASAERATLPEIRQPIAGPEPFRDFRPENARHESGLQPARKELTMPVLATTYLVAFCAMTFSGLSALALIYTVNHLDPADTHETGRESREHVAV
jgi:hypothetical protein